MKVVKASNASSESSSVMIPPILVRNVFCVPGFIREANFRYMKSSSSFEIAGRKLGMSLTIRWAYRSSQKVLIAPAETVAQLIGVNSRLEFTRFRVRVLDELLLCPAGIE